jgi:abortive infection bacteriophage resistance protein
MANISNDDIAIHYDPTKLVDEISSTEIYIGISNNDNNETASTWQIKKIWQDGTVWKFEYPNGKQDFIYAWSNRFGYDYE